MIGSIKSFPKQDYRGSTRIGTGGANDTTLDEKGMCLKAHSTWIIRCVSQIKSDCEELAILSRIRVHEISAYSSPASSEPPIELHGVIESKVNELAFGCRKPIFTFDDTQFKAEEAAYLCLESCLYETPCEGLLDWLEQCRYPRCTIF